MADQSVLIAGLIRVLTAACVVAGVLAMHGLTSGHHPTMLSPSGDPQVSVGAGHVAHITADVTLPMVAAPQRAGPAVELVPFTGSHGMAGLCLAVLVSVLLLVVPAAALRIRQARRPVRSRPVRGWPAPGRSPPWMAPSMSKLCVLRT